MSMSDLYSCKFDAMKTTALCLCWLFLQVLCTPAQSQDVKIRVMNAHSGKPVKNECLNLSFGHWPGVEGEFRNADMTIPVDKEGVISLRISEGQVTTSNRRNICNGLEKLGPLTLENPPSLMVLGDWYVVCQKPEDALKYRVTDGKTVPTQPVYRIAQIMQSGISAPNTCGKARVQAKPGELVLFVRPLSLIEKLLL